MVTVEASWATDDGPLSKYRSPDLGSIAAATMYISGMDDILDNLFECGVISDYNICMICNNQGRTEGPY